MENEEIDYKQYYIDNLRYKVAYCGKKEEGHFFKLGEWGYQIETLDVDTDEYGGSQYVWYHVFDMLLDGVWTVEGFTMCDDWKNRKIAELENSLKVLERDRIRYTEHLEKLKK